MCLYGDTIVESRRSPTRLKPCRHTVQKWPHPILHLRRASRERIDAYQHLHVSERIKFIRDVTRKQNIPIGSDTRLRPKPCLLQARSFEQIRSAEVLCICDTAPKITELLGAASVRTETVLIAAGAHIVALQRAEPAQQLKACRRVWLTYLARRSRERRPLRP